MVPPLPVRAATIEDAAGIAEVHVRSWRETYTGLMPDRLLGADALAERRRMWSSILGMDPLPGRIAVAEHDPRIVGFAFAGSADHPDANHGHPPVRYEHLYSIYVLASEHSTGTGRALLAAVLGDRPAQLWVTSTNQRARAFYERNGFRSDGASYVDPDMDGLVVVRMVR